MPLSVLRGQGPPGTRWTEHDRTTAVALTLWEALQCPGCGQPLEESTDPEADPSRVDGAWHYDVPTPTRCHACTAVHVAQEPYGEAAAPHALRFHPVRVDHDDHPPS